MKTTQRRSWARSLLEAGAGWPQYGSEAWNTLALEDPRRLAACVAAAESYTQRYDDLEQILHRELAAERLACKHAEDEEYQQQAAAHRKQWQGRFNRTVVPFEERRQRRIEAEKRMAERAGGGA